MLNNEDPELSELVVDTVTRYAHLIRDDLSSVSFSLHYTTFLLLDLTFLEIILHLRKEVFFSTKL